jgi:hypothetical protein
VGSGAVGARTALLERWADKTRGRRWRWRGEFGRSQYRLTWYSGGSGRVIVWCDKYIVTDTLYNTSLSVSDLSSTSLSVKYSNYYKPAIKFNTSWVPNTTGSYYSSTTSN